MVNTRPRQGLNERESKMNSKELAGVIQVERERLEELQIAVSQQQRRIAELVSHKIRVDNDEADKFFSDHFKIISVK